MNAAELPFTVAVILNFNRPEDTLACIRSLQQGTFIPQKILVVDNHSSDNSVEVISCAFPEIEIVRNKENRGYAGGMNSGIRRALELHPEYILILNSDTVVDRDYSRAMVLSLSQDRSAGAAGGTIYYSGRRAHDIWYAGGEINYWRASGFPRHENPKTHGNLHVTFLTGCAMLLRTAAIAEAGLFDERFFMYLEDVELSYRLTRHGFRLLYVPDAVCYHKVEHEGDRPLPLYFSVRNRLLFLHLCATGLQSAVGFVYLGSTLALKLVFWRLTNPPLFRAALSGINDYRRRIFGVGRGLTFAGNET